MLSTAFNAILGTHSRAAQLKRLGTPDIYSPCRITPANYFRFLRGPEHTTIHGREFIIPLATLSGEFSASIAFSAAPVVGVFKIQYGAAKTGDLAFNATASDIQTALRLISGLGSVTVSGSIAAGLGIVFSGVSTLPVILVTDSTLATAAPAAVTAVVTDSFTEWSVKLQRNDRIIDPVYGMMTIDEAIEIPDLGGNIMGWRCRAE